MFSADSCLLLVLESGPALEGCWVLPPPQEPCVWRPSHGRQSSTNSLCHEASPWDPFFSRCSGMGHPHMLQSSQHQTTTTRSASSQGSSTGNRKTDDTNSNVKSSGVKPLFTPCLITRLEVCWEYDEQKTL